MLALDVIVLRLLQSQGHPGPSDLTTIVIDKTQQFSIILAHALPGCLLVISQQTLPALTRHSGRKVFSLRILLKVLNAHVFAKIGADGSDYNRLPIARSKEGVFNIFSCNSFKCDVLEQLFQGERNSKAHSVLLLFISTDNEPFIFFIIIK